MFSVLTQAALAQDPARLGDAVDPRSQEVFLAVDPAVREYHGRTSIVLDVPASTRSFTLHADELVLGEVVVRKGKREVDAVATPIAHGLVRIETERTLKRGTWTVEIAFDGTLHDETYGLYRFERGGQWYVVSQFEANDARTAWPCFDEPAFKIPLRLSVDVPAGLIAVGNAPIETDQTRDGVRSVGFAATPPIPMYAAALAVGPYVATPVEGMPLPGVIWTVAGLETYAPTMRDVMPPIVDWLVDWFGTPIPYPKLDSVVVPEFTFGAMENPGAIVYDAGYLSDPAHQTDEQREALIHVVTHEMAHLWFGDWVTPEWWDDLWLNESFADWAAIRGLASLDPASRGEMREVEAASEMIADDGRASVRPLRTEVDPTAVFETANFAVYVKGRLVLDQVEAWIGPDKFQQGVRAYLAARPFGSASAEDLFDALSAVSGQDVKRMMLPYLDTPGAPRIAFERLADGKFRLSQRRYTVLGSAPETGGPWIVPVRMRIGRPDGTAEVRTVLVDEASVEADLGDVAWILPAADGIGYYAWSLPADLRTALIRATPTLLPVERLRVVDALRLELRAGDVALADVLGAVPSFAADDDPRVVQAVLRLVDQVQLVERLDDPALEARADAWRREHAHRWLDPLGLEPVAGEAADRAQLRRVLLEVLADAHDPQIREHGREVGEQFLTDPASVNHEVGAWGLQILAEDTPTLQPRLLAKLAEETDPSMRAMLFRAVGQVGGDAARDAARVAALAPGLSFHDLLEVIQGIESTRTHEADLDEKLGWTIASYDTLVTRVPPVIRPYMAYGGGCSLERLERSREFFLDPTRNVAGTEQVLDDSADLVRQCRLEVETHGPSLKSFLSAAPASSGSAP